MIYHIATVEDWKIDQNSYQPSAFEKEKFIHCSEKHQVTRIANTLFKNRTDLMLLEIDPTQLNAKTIYENCEGGEEKFPHVYGPLKKSEIIKIHQDWKPMNGQFSFPEE